MDIDPVQFIEQRYHIRLRQKNHNEWAGPCIFTDCPGGPGDDRFVVLLVGQHGEPTYFCRQCNRSGFVRNLDENQKPPTREEQLEWRIRQLERKQAEQEKRLTALEQMAKCTDHLRYHFEMPDDAMLYWIAQGIDIPMIDKYKLGFCPHCPTDYERRASYTIPVFERDVLRNIRHRLVRAENGDKYRPHIAGLGVQLFNADMVNDKRATQDGLLILEGEKKSVVLDAQGFASVATMGKRSFMREWVAQIKSAVSTVYVALDPDALESAKRLAGFFGDMARVVKLPAKADDFFVIHGGSPSDFRYYLSQARPAR